MVDGQDPADFGSSYPYIRPVVLGYLPAKVAQVQPFLDFVTSPEAQELLVEQGVIPAK
jgi:ABC-type phosphate transport system substrate-binding protein